MLLASGKLTPRELMSNNHMNSGPHCLACSGIMKLAALIMGSLSTVVFSSGMAYEGVRV